MFVLARTSNPLHKIAQAMRTPALLFEGSAMPRFKGETITLTNATIKTLVVPDGKPDKLWFDTEPRGFFVRKFKSGKATYGVKYRCKGRQRRITLGPVLPGNLDKMRAIASEAIAQARVGVDMYANAKAEARAAQVKRNPTLGDLLPPYLEIREKGDPEKLWKALRRNSLEDVTRYLKRAWLPLHALMPDAVTRQMIVDRMSELAIDSGPIAAKRAHAALSTYFAWLIHNNHRSGANPCMDIKLAKEERRTRTLDDAELLDVWLAADAMGGEFGAIVKLLILTGQRLREIGDLEWAEIKDHQIELPERRTKNGKPHIIPLSAPALALLQAIPQHEGCGLVFLGRRGRGMTSYSRQKDKLDKRIATARMAAGKPPIAHWTLHDIRRSVVSGLVKSRVRDVDGKLQRYRFCLPHVVEMLVNHISGHKAGVAGTYNTETYLEERREALEQWGAHLAGLVSTVHGAPAQDLMTAAPSRAT
jgi:integrase